MNGVSMRSGRPVGSGAFSELGLCFFMLKKDVELSRILERAAELVDWDAHADDGEW